MARPMTTGDAGRFQDLENRTSHIDSEVSRVQADVSGLKAQLQAQGQQLNRIETLLMAPKDGPSYSAWAGVVVTILFGLGAMFVGISGYVDLQLTPVKESVAEVSTAIIRESEYHSIDSRKQLDAAFELGRTSADLANLTYRINHYDELHHAIDDRLRVVEEKAAAANVSRKAIGDYTKELGAKVP